MGEVHLRHEAAPYLSVTATARLTPRQNAKAPHEAGLSVERVGNPYWPGRRGPITRGPRGRTSGCSDVYCCRALLTLLDVESHFLTFIEGLIPVAVDGCVVDENVLATVFGSDEAEALRRVEPLDCTSTQNNTLYRKNCCFRRVNQSTVAAEKTPRRTLAILSPNKLIDPVRTIGPGEKPPNP